MARQRSSTPTAQSPARPAGHTGGVGLNPFRTRRRSPLDVVFVAAAIVVCAALLVWALVG
jgi:hypothetical protein